MADAGAVGGIRPAQAGGVGDPILGSRWGDLTCLTLPAWQVLVGWLMTLAVLSCAVAAVFLLISGGARAMSGRLSTAVPLPWRGLAATGGFLLLVLAARVVCGPLCNAV